MAKGVLSFDLPEEEEAFRLAQEGGEWKYVMMDVLNHIRNKIKYGQPMDHVKIHAYDEIRELIWTTINDRNLKVD
jgi:hypothetical protein